MLVQVGHGDAQHWRYVSKAPPPLAQWVLLSIACLPTGLSRHNTRLEPSPCWPG